MPDSIHPKRLTRSPRAHLLAVAILVNGILVAGCGGKLQQPDRDARRRDARLEPPAPARQHHCARHRTTGGGAASSSATAQRPAARARVRQVHARQRRAQLPGPERRGGLTLSGDRRHQSVIARVPGGAGEVPEASAGGGPPGPGTTTHPSAQTLSKLLRIAECLRRHGVHQFPDPQTFVPSNIAGTDEITDFDGAILLFPTTINLQAPAYRQALTACGAPPLGLPH